MLQLTVGDIWYPEVGREPRTRRRSLAIGGYGSSACGVWAGPVGSGVPCGTAVPVLSNTLADVEGPAGGVSISTQ
jgi:hypothetical protein